MGAGHHQGEVPGCVGQSGREIDPIAHQAGRAVESQRHEGRRACQVGDAADLQGGLKIGIAAEAEVGRQAGADDPPLRQRDAAVGDPAGAAIPGGPAPLAGDGQARPGDVDRHVGQLGELQLGELDGAHAHGVSDSHPARSAPGEAGEGVRRRLQRQDDVAQPRAGRGDGRPLGGHLVAVGQPQLHSIAGDVERPAEIGRDVAELDAPDGELRRCQRQLVSPREIAKAAGALQRGGHP